jgi:hypothetical protein
MTLVIDTGKHAASQTDIIFDRNARGYLVVRSFSRF